MVLMIGKRRGQEVRMIRVGRMIRAYQRRHLTVENREDEQVVV